MSKTEKTISIIGISVTIIGIIIGIFSLIPNHTDRKIDQVIDKLNTSVRVVEYKDNINTKDLLYLAALVEAISSISMQKDVYIESMIKTTSHEGKRSKEDTLESIARQINKQVTNQKFDNGLVVKSLAQKFSSVSGDTSDWHSKLVTKLEYPGGFEGAEKISYLCKSSNNKSVCMFREDLSNLSIANFISVLNQSGIIITDEKKVDANVTDISIKDINSNIEAVISMDKQKMILTAASTGR